MSLEDRQDSVFMAKLAEKAERYDEMVESITKVAETDQGLTVEEKNLLSVAFKNVIDPRRASWRLISGMEKEEENLEKLEHLRAYREVIEDEMVSVCNKAVVLIDKHLLPTSTSEESSVFYYTMKGDYYKYLAEFTTGQERKGSAEHALVAYKAASDAVMSGLAPTHPLRLGLALNLSVFYDEILKSPDRAHRLVKAAFDNAIAEWEGLSEESQKDSAPIMELLRDKITLWTNDIQQGDNDPENNRTRSTESYICFYSTEKL